MNDTNIEETRLELERERLVLEQRRAEREGSLLNRHFSAIITAMVSVATVIVTVTVSLAQIEVAKIHKSREFEVQQRESERGRRLPRTQQRHRRSHREHVGGTLRQRDEPRHGAS